MKTSTGSKDLDEFLGGYEDDIITMIYGPSGTAKSTLCLMATASLVKQNKRVIYIDTGSEFSIDRLKQLIGKDYEKTIENILVLKINSFEEQKNKINELSKLVKQNNIHLIVLDNLSFFYRLELQNKDPKIINKEIAMQLKQLRGINKTENIPILITNQVYDDLQTKGVKMVGGNFIQNFSKCIIELKKENKRKIIIKKHRSLPEQELTFKITNEGVIKDSHL